MTRLPMPEWGRAGETWRVEPEPGWVLASDGVCHSKHCYDDAVVFRARPEFALCRRHLRDSLMWVEDGRVVSWCLRP